MLIMDIFMLSDNDLWGIFWVLFFLLSIVKAFFYGLTLYKHGWKPKSEESEEQKAPIINNYYNGEKNGH